MERKQILDIVNSDAFINWFYELYEHKSDHNSDPLTTLLSVDIIILEQPIREWADKQERRTAVMRKAQARDRLIELISEFQASQATS